MNQGQLLLRLSEEGGCRVLQREALLQLHVAVRPVHEHLERLVLLLLRAEQPLVLLHRVGAPLFVIHSGVT